MNGNVAGWMFVWIGLLIAGMGLAWLFVPWFGRLPGDIRIEGNGGGFYFPVMTCIVLSVALSLILTVVRMFAR
jgi:hypothetical protein